MQTQVENSKPLLSAVAKQVLLLVDWDNIFFGLFSRFGPEEMQIGDRLKRLVEWVKEDIGELLGGFGFVFAPEHLSFFHQQICVENGFKLMICPKRQLAKLKINPKTGESISVEDTVDETIIWFAEIMLRHPNFKFICLASGDSDYVPLLAKMEHCGIKRALAIPALSSLSKTKELIRLADKHPTTLKKMLLRLDYT